MSTAKMKRSLAGVWEHSWWLFICCCELPGKGFLTQLGRKNLTAEFSVSVADAQSKLTSNSPQMKSVHTTRKTTRSEQKKGLELMGSFLATRSLIWVDY